MSEIKLTREEKRELKEWLFDELDMLCEYHYDLRPLKRDSLDTLMSKYFYWGDEYNDEYISVEEDANENKLAAYLVQEFKKFMEIPVSVRYWC